MIHAKPRTFSLLPGIALMAVLPLAGPAGAGPLPEDFQRYVINLEAADHAAGGEMTLHLNYQDGRFLQGWVDIGGRPVGSRVDVSQLALRDGAMQGSVDVVLGTGRRNNRFLVIDVDARVDEAGRVTGEHKTRYGLEAGHTYGSGFYIFTDDRLDHDVPVVTKEQIRFLRAGDAWSGPAEGTLQASVRADQPVRFRIDMGQPLRGPSANWQREVFLDLVIKGDELVSADAHPVRDRPWRLREDIQAKASFDGERIKGEVTIDIEATYPHSGEYRFTFEGEVKFNNLVGQTTVYHENPHGHYGTRETTHPIRGRAELVNAGAADPANAVHRIEFKPSRGVNRDAVAMIQLKDGKLAGALVEPIHRGGGVGFLTSVLESEISLEDSRLRGSLKFDPNNPGYPEEWGKKELVYEFDLRIDDLDITGTYDVRFDRLRNTGGAVSGRRIPTQELRAANPAPQVNWPTWHGPNHSLSAAKTGTPLLDDPAEARLLWRSERTPPARSQIQRYGQSNIGRNLTGGPGGGAGSPVVYDGKVYLHYYEPSGDASTALSVARSYGRQLNETWKILADDVVICIDLETGATLWKQRFEQTGLNLYNTWKEAPGSTVSVGEGKVFAVGSGGKLWALDAETGEVVWESGLPGFYEGMQRNRQRSLAENSRPDAGSFHAGTRIVVDGLLVGTNFGGDLVGIDTNTGEKRWRVEGVIASQNTPSLWRGHTEPVVIVKNSPTISAVTVAEGRLLWQKDVARIPRSYPIPVEGDILTAIVNAESGDDVHLAGFRIGADGLERLWTVEKAHDHTARRPLMIHDGHSYSLGREGHDDHALYRVNLETGEFTSLEDPGSLGSMVILSGVEDRVMFDRNRHRFVTADDDLRRISDVWNVPLRTTGGYHNTQMTDAIVDGRLIVRGGNGIYAFDLRRHDD